MTLSAQSAQNLLLALPQGANRLVPAIYQSSSNTLLLLPTEIAIDQEPSMVDDNICVYPYGTVFALETYGIICALEPAQ